MVVLHQQPVFESHGGSVPRDGRHRDVSPQRHRVTEQSASLLKEAFEKDLLKNLGVSVAPWQIILCLVFLCFCISCSKKEPPPQPLAPQVSGTLAIDGLSAPVRILRDRWGVPHIYAESTADLFTAQGFVQAEDRLFQMDLWRRAAQGRLSEVLGANFIERDAMTRRVQYRGDLDAEWASYGADARTIAEAFVRGINAWVAVARVHRPEMFMLAGWSPEIWSPNDLLNRTDAFVESGDALDEVRRAQLSDVVGDAIRRVGAKPFFVSLAAPVMATPGSKASVDSTHPGNVRLQPDPADGYVSASRGSPLVFSEAAGAFANPSTRYLVHLHAPGWNVIGATRPWLPGVAIGHNDRVGWAMTPIAADTQDVSVEPLISSHGTIVSDAIGVKAAKPFPYTSEFRPHGLVVASDRERDRVFVVRWSGTEPGAASELGSLALDRARTWPEFRAALERWKMPARRVAYSDAEGNIGMQDAALIPLRRAGEWRGWIPLNDLPHAFNPSDGTITAGQPRSSSRTDTRPALFAHLLGVTDAARRRFNTGPLPAPPGDDRPVRGSFDAAEWDRSRALVAPGQSEWADSAHYRDLAALWSNGEEILLAFTDAAVAASAETTLMLVPRR
jgi:acyl-homoserine lactone acylase PvdQ